ncbi:FecCD family ABC transporter permease [Marinobacterium rhizophilum]|uniref:Iron ABC transporter permease n=1 Tax=Marinobacterium rhizophilum TaxID=420402 RepID=A0ABY5HEN5_9GAMM|nr:iron ABC transporter permease [Marinobacterium rhizophilum]UTW10827.1 iron ABC transporter permease [Marinobacterium rhizophilum]
MSIQAQCAPAAQLQRFECPRFLGLALLLLGLVGGALVLNLLYGAVTLTPLQVWQALTGEGDAVATDIVWNLRLPRVLLAGLVGMHFAIAGSLLQAVMRNPLADAGVLGINAGASLAAVLAFVLAERFWGGSGAYSALSISLDWLPLLSCGGGILAAAAVYRLGWNRGVTPVRLVLSGIAVASVLSALATGVLAGWGSMNTETVLIWLAGSLFGRDWAHLWALLPWTLLALGLLPALLAGANLLQLGDDVASSLGLRVELWRFALLLVAVLFAASAVGVVGPVGFVGLIVAQIARLSCGPDLRLQLLLGPLFGALLVMLSDLLGRLLLVPAEIPIGVITSLLGVPFFIYLLARRQA